MCAFTIESHFFFHVASHWCDLLCTRAARPSFFLPLLNSILSTCPTGVLGVVTHISAQNSTLCQGHSITISSNSPNSCKVAILIPTLQMRIVRTWGFSYHYKVCNSEDCIWLELADVSGLDLFKWGLGLQRKIIYKKIILSSLFLHLQVLQTTLQAWGSAADNPMLAGPMAMIEYNTKCVPSQSPSVLLVFLFEWHPCAASLLEHAINSF